MYQSSSLMQTLVLENIFIGSSTSASFVSSTDLSVSFVMGIVCRSQVRAVWPATKRGYT